MAGLEALGLGVQQLRARNTVAQGWLPTIWDLLIPAHGFLAIAKTMRRILQLTHPVEP